MRSAILVLAALLASPAVAQPLPAGPQPRSPGGLLPVPPALPGAQGLYGPDTDGDEDKRPELAPYQQGGGQQTGGPARNLIPGDNLHIVPR